MKKEELKKEIQELIIEAQRNEVTEYHIYKSLARQARSHTNQKLLEQIASEELEHYRFWMTYSDEVDPVWWKVNLYIFLSRVFGFVFALKLMERREQIAEKKYLEISKFIPDVSKIASDEKGHEMLLLNMVTDSRLKGMGTWMISVNLVVFSLICLMFSLSFYLPNPLQVASFGMMSVLAVASADLFITLFLRNIQSFGKDQIKKGIVRFVSGIVIGAFILIPFTLSVDGYSALTLSTTIAFLVSLLLNYQFAIVSDQKGLQRIGRIFLVTLLMASIGLAIGFVLHRLYPL
jgi:VIT1/CCC1 family predicted Fe2+/Mn2+ transporter